MADISKMKLPNNTVYNLKDSRVAVPVPADAVFTDHIFSGLAEDVNYDNSDSGLTSTTIQDAIDEIADGGSTGCVELTQAQYDALSEEEKMDDVIYLITDSPDNYPDASNVVYSNTTSGLTATNVQDAVDEVNSKSIASITRSGNTFSAKNSSGNQLFTFDQKDENTWNPAAIINISRNGTTFTATRANNTTFTFDQQDNNTDIHGYEVVNYNINNLNGGFTNSGNCQFACKFVRYGDLVVASGSMHTGSNITGDINTYVFILPWAAHEQFAFQWTQQSSTAIIKGYCNGTGVYFRAQPAANTWYQWCFAYIR